MAGRRIKHGKGPDAEHARHWRDRFAVLAVVVALLFTGSALLGLAPALVAPAWVHARDAARLRAAADDPAAPDP